MTGSGTDRTRPLIIGGPVIVLVRPQLAENIGMVARAMANFGLSELRLVSPRDGWPKKGVRQAASGAVHVLDEARLFDTLAEAVADLHKVFATTARGRGQLKPVHGADAAAQEAKMRLDSGEKTGFVFGPERTGLDNDDVVLADAIVTFPVNPAFSSLNLAQAVLLVGYEWFRAAHVPPAPEPAEGYALPPTREALFSFFEYLESELDQAGFFVPADKKPIMWRNLRNILHRLSMTDRDLRTLRGVFSTLVQGRRGGHNQLRENRRMATGVRPESD